MKDYQARIEATYGNEGTIKCRVDGNLGKILDLLISIMAVSISDNSRTWEEAQEIAELEKINLMNSLKEHWGSMKNAEQEDKS